MRVERTAGAYAVGRAWGRHRTVPIPLHPSPNWDGRVLVRPHSRTLRAWTARLWPDLDPRELTGSEQQTYARWQASEMGDVRRPHV